MKLGVTNRSNPLTCNIWHQLPGKSALGLNKQPSTPKRYEQVIDAEVSLERHGFHGGIVALNGEASQRDAIESVGGEVGRYAPAILCACLIGGTADSTAGGRSTIRHVG